MSGLEVFADNIWIAEGPEVRDFGVMWNTRMIVVKLSSGAVWVDSPVLVPFETLRQIAGLGPVRYLIAGTPRHVWRLETWHRLFPAAELWACRPTPMTLKGGPLPLTGILSDTPHPDWEKDLDQLAFKGNPLIEEIFFYHKESRTLILDDMIQNHPPTRDHPLRDILFRLSGVAHLGGGVPLDIRLSFTNRGLARQSLDTLLSWDFDRLIIAHGPCLKNDAKPLVEEAFRWLRR
jgi:hypothetical protein